MGRAGWQAARLVAVAGLVSVGGIVAARAQSAAAPPESAAGATAQVPAQNGSGSARAEPLSPVANAHGALVGPRTASILHPTGSAGAPVPQGPFTSVSNRLADWGVSFRGVLVNESAGNPVGGVHQGFSNVGQLNFGSDLDLQKMLGLHGAAFHFTIYRDYGYSLAKQQTGTFAPQQNIYKNPYTKIHYGLFAYEQKLFGNRLDVTIGRLGTTAYYGHVVSNCIFMEGSACGMPDILKTEAGYGLLPSATWGTNIVFRPRRDMYIQTGAYEVNPTIQPSTGLDWSIHDSTGVTIPVEIAWARPSLATTRYPFQIKAGAYDTTAPHADPFLNTKNVSIVKNGGTAKQDTARDGVYILAYDTLWRPDPRSTRNIAVFGGYVQPLEKEETLDQEVFAGVQVTGVIPRRPNDTFGVLGTYLQVSEREIEYLDAEHAKLGGHGRNSPDEGVFEIAYQAQVMRYFRVTPNIQYWVHPDNSQIAATKNVSRNILVLGLSMSVGWSNILGFAGTSPGVD